MLLSDSYYATSQVTILGDKDVYLHGEEKLNNLCNELYGTTIGTARSIAIEDINKLVGYYGPKGSYRNTEGKIEYTSEPEKIAILEKKFNSLSSSELPDDTPLGDYTSNMYYIDEESNMKSPENLKYVVTEVDSFAEFYIVASKCVQANFETGIATFCLFSGAPGTVSSHVFFDSTGYDDYGFQGFIRPIVTLNSDVTLEKTTDGNWKIN